MESSPPHRGDRIFATAGKYWLQVVFSTPQLWSTLKEFMSSKQLGLAIERSRTTPLHIHFQGAGVWPSAVIQKRKIFVESIVPQMPRWKTLEGDNIPRSILDHLEFDATALQILQLKSSVISSTLPSPGLADAVQLRHLELTGIGITWTSRCNHRLTHLQLSTLNTSHAPSLVEVLCILAHCPQLEVFSLNDVAITETTLSPASLLNSDPVLPFLSLRRLRLNGIPSGAYYHLLSRLCFLNCTNIELAPDPPTTMTNDHHVEYQHDAPSFVEKIRSALLCDGLEPINVTLGNGNNAQAFSLNTSVKQWGPDTPGLNLYLQASSQMGTLAVAQQIIEIVLQACPIATPLHLEIGLTRTPQYPIEFLARFDDTNTVEKITLSWNADIQTILRYITRRPKSPAAGEATGWLFPRLKAISLVGLDGSYSVTAIRDWVKERWVKCKANDATRPEGFIKVTMPILKGGKTEFWKSTPKKRSGRRAPTTVWKSDWRGRVLNCQIFCRFNLVKSIATIHLFPAYDT
ncbi:hypothetical protein FRB95_005970 [Tulasnella sp. JGI-2019a]|nr:hypothetical protein FRB93_010193 [Tulasnella sp. JGI-2019a]KAG9037331.1 hypothetical protein FRB95_005970 [Tulasnella sp. JGI-2019a]